MFRRALIVLLIALLLPAVLLAFLGTATARDLVLTRVLVAVDGSVGEAEGSLLGTLELHGLELAGGTLKIRRLQLRWEPAALLRREVLVERIALQAPVLDLGARPGAEDQAPGEPFAGLRLPVSIRVEEFVVEELAIAGVAGVETLRADLATALHAHETQVEFSDVDLELRAPEQGTLRVLGTAGLALERELPWKLDVRAALAPAGGDGVEFAVAADGNTDSARAEVDVLDPWTAHAEIESDALAAGRFRARVTLPDPIAFGDLRVLRASLDAEGDPTAATLTADATLELDDPLAERPLRFEATADAELRTEVIDFVLSGTAPAFSFDAEGSTTLDGFGTRAAVSLDLRDAARWLPERALAFRARANVALPAPLETERIVDIERITLDGTLDRRSLAVRGAGRLLTGGAIAADGVDLDLRLGPNHLMLRGSAGERLDLDLDLDAPDLSDVAPEISGTARLRARLGGVRTAPTLSLDGSLGALALGELRLETLVAHAAFDEAAAQPLRLRIDARSLTHPSLPSPVMVDLEAGGRRENITAALNGALGDDTLELRLALALDAPAQALNGRVEDLVLDTDLAGRWALEAPTALGLDRQTRTLDLAGACLVSNDARLCSDALRVALPTDAPVRVDGLALRLDDLPFARLGRWLPPTVGIDGVLSARAALDGTRAELTLASSDADLSLRDPGSGEVLFADRLAEGAFELQRIDDRLSGAVLLRLDTAGEVRIEGDMRADTTAKRLDDLDLSATLAIGELAFLDPFLPALSAPTGRLEGALRIRGSSDDPLVTGQLTLGAEAFVPALGRALAIRDLSLTGSATDGVRIDGRLVVDDTSLALGGSADYDASTGMTGSLSVSGRNAQILALPDLTLWVSPDLEATLENDILDLRGRIDLPRARIAINSVPASGPTRSSDLILHRPDQETPARPLRTRADIDVSLGDDVQLLAGSLRTRLIGDLELALGLDETLTARGLIETRGGSVSRFGRELAIARGRLAFDGPISRPDLNVTATRTAGTREVGVTISGPPDALQTTLFSSPPADDATTLTMLVTGREPSQASREDVDRVSAAALGLGVGVANPVLQDLGERFGIEEFGIDTSTGTGAVVAGTRLSERLYARYAYTLATRSSGLQLEYRISDRLSARTETGSVTALDLLYRREFD